MSSHKMDDSLYTSPGQVRRFQASDLVGDDWYTNPHGNEVRGRYYDMLRSAKERDAGNYHPPTFVVQLRDAPDRPRRRYDKWAEMDTGREISGCLTDFEVMARMGLIRVRAVLTVDELDTAPRVDQDRLGQRYDEDDRGDVQRDLKGILV